MAYHSSTYGVAASGTRQASAADRVRSIQSSYRRWRLFRRTMNELGMLTDRDLADLGLSRSDVRRVAHEAAYGV